jgi:hypothetical protein
VREQEYTEHRAPTLLVVDLVLPHTHMGWRVCVYVCVCVCARACVCVGGGVRAPCTPCFAWSTHPKENAAEKELISLKDDVGVQV